MIPPVPKAIPSLVARGLSKWLHTPAECFVMLADHTRWCWPLPDAADGRHPSISDGFHPRGDKSFRGGVGHRGVDLMYWRERSPLGVNHPWQSKGFEILPGTRAVACGAGVVTVSKRLATGGAVSIDHGDGIETAYHHLAEQLVQPGDVVQAGTPVGVVGGSPVGYGLVHLHFDLVVCGTFTDAAPYLKKHWAYSKAL